MKSPQDVDRATEASQRALATLGYWRGEEARKLAALAHIRAEIIAAEKAHHKAEIARTAASAPGDAP
jgi:hypothetical protein